MPPDRLQKASVSDDKRLLLRFNELGYQDPFYQQSMSDGTLKMLAYAVLLADPSPRPFIGIEEQGATRLGQSTRDRSTVGRKLDTRFLWRNIVR